MREKKKAASRPKEQPGGLQVKREDAAKIGQGDFDNLMQSLRGRYKGSDSLVETLRRERRRG